MSSDAVGGKSGSNRFQELGELRAELGALVFKARRDTLLLAVIAVAYFVMFALVRPESLSGLVLAVGRNVISLTIAGLITRPAILRALRLRSGIQFPVHGLLALAFSLLWLWLLTVTGGLLGGRSALQFTVDPFLYGLAADWQLFQGLFVYALLAVLCVLDGRPGTRNALVVVDDMSKAPGENFLLRNGEDLTALRATEIVCVRGADDYSEVVTVGGSRLVQTRLAEFEAALDPRRFVRVHRSAIINIDHIVRCRAAGNGRLTVQMAAGPDVPASRAGARALKGHAL